MTAQDFIRALEREANPKANVGGYSFYYSVIKGFDDFASGKADSISGLSAPDDSTLQIEVDGSDGRPELPPGHAGGRSDPAERRRAARVPPRDTTRTTVGSWWPTGPYEFEGADALDFSQPAADQTPVAGYVAGPLDRPGPQPRLGRGDRRPASGLPGPHRGRRSVATTTTSTTRSSRTTWTSSWTAPCRRR